jgi:hypothetical protein
VVPIAVTEKVAVWPAVTVWLAGWVAMEGAAALITGAGCELEPQAESIRLKLRKKEN